MTPEERKAVVQTFYARVVNGGDYDAVYELLSDDFVNHDQSPAMPPGREGVARFFRMLREGFPDLRYDVHLYLVDGDKVADRGVATGTHLGVYAGIPPTGNRFSMREHHIY
ncbi:MAG: ester cyclase, partial [Dehalococcoidia bacterium]|nr:ester cyclase [Dehalococcoidia bacterium]